MAEQKPIDQFFHHCNSNTEMLYEAMPYVQFAFKRPLALYIKMQEMQQSMQGFDDNETLSACGLEETSHNVEDMLYAMRTKANDRNARQLDMMLSVIQAGKMYRTIQELKKNSENADMTTILQSFMKGECYESKLAE